MIRRFIILTILSLAFSASQAYAQYEVVDTVKTRLHYLMRYHYSNESRQREEEFNLDIGTNKVLFINRWDPVKMEIGDSVKAHGGNTNDVIVAWGGYPISSFLEDMIKNHPSKGKLSYYTNLDGKTHEYVEDIADKGWKIEEGDTVILGYHCNKATCTFRGRTWTAWFTPEIPISEGPWKLDGLPGMILFAEETKHQFRFECIGIKNDVNKPMKTWHVKTIKSTPLKVQKLKIMEVEDEEAFLKLTGFDGIRGGVVKSKQKYTACLIERY